MSVNNFVATNKRKLDNNIANNIANNNKRKKRKKSKAPPRQQAQLAWKGIVKNGQNEYIKIMYTK